MSKRDGLDLVDYLKHIQQAIGRIECYLNDIDQGTFLASGEKQDAVVRNLEIIGEAAGNIRRHFPDFEDRHPELPLKIAYQMRNVLIHGYFQIDLEIIWKTIKHNLPSLSTQVEEVLQELQGTSSAE